MSRRRSPPPGRGPMECLASYLHKGERDMFQVRPNAPTFNTVVQQERACCYLQLQVWSEVRQNITLQPLTGYTYLLETPNGDVSMTSTAVVEANQWTSVTFWIQW